MAVKVSVPILLQLYEYSWLKSYRKVTPNINRTDYCHYGKGMYSAFLDATGENYRTAKRKMGALLITSQGPSSFVALILEHRAVGQLAKSAEFKAFKLNLAYKIIIHF